MSMYVPSHPLKPVGLCQMVGVYLLAVCFVCLRTQHMHNRSAMFCKHVVEHVAHLCTALTVLQWPHHRRPGSLPLTSTLNCCCSFCPPPLNCSLSPDHFDTLFEPSWSAYPLAKGEKVHPDSSNVCGGARGSVTRAGTDNDASNRSWGSMPLATATAAATMCRI